MRPSGESLWGRSASSRAPPSVQLDGVRGGGGGGRRRGGAAEERRRPIKRRNNRLVGAVGERPYAQSLCARAAIVAVVCVSVGVGVVCAPVGFARTATRPIELRAAPAREDRAEVEVEVESVRVRVEPANPTEEICCDSLLREAKTQSSTSGALKSLPPPISDPNSGAPSRLFGESLALGGSFSRAIESVIERPISLLSFARPEVGSSTKKRIKKRWKRSTKLTSSSSSSSSPTLQQQQKEQSSRSKQAAAIKSDSQAIVFNVGNSQASLNTSTSSNSSDQFWASFSDAQLVELLAEFYAFLQQTASSEPATTLSVPKERVLNSNDSRSDQDDDQVSIDQATKRRTSWWRLKGAQMMRPGGGLDSFMANTLSFASNASSNLATSASTTTNASHLSNSSTATTSSPSSTSSPSTSGLLLAGVSPVLAFGAQATGANQTTTTAATTIQLGPSASQSNVFGGFNADESLLLLGWLKNKQNKYTSLKNVTFELIDERPNRLINVCLDGPKILILPNVSDIIYCYTREQWIEKLWSEALRLSTFHYPIIVLNMLIFLFGTIGNIFVCLSVKRNYQLRNVTNYFIVNLAFADFLVILICLPATVIWDLSLTWFFDTIPCKLIMFLQDVSISVSVLTLTAISIDRYYAICYPLKFKSSLNQAKKVIALIWFVSLIIMSPDLIYLSAHRSTDLTEAGLDTVLYSDCNYDWSEQSSRAFQFVKTILLYLLPFLLMFCAHYRILKVLKLASTMVAASSQQQLAAVAAAAAAASIKPNHYELRALGRAPSTGSDGSNTNHSSHAHQTGAGKRPHRFKSKTERAAAAVASNGLPEEEPNGLRPSTTGKPANNSNKALAAAIALAQAVTRRRSSAMMYTSGSDDSAGVAVGSQLQRPTKVVDFCDADVSDQANSKQAEIEQVHRSDKSEPLRAKGCDVAAVKAAASNNNKNNIAVVDNDCSTVIVELSSSVVVLPDDNYNVVCACNNNGSNSVVGGSCAERTELAATMAPQMRQEICPPPSSTSVASIRQVRFVDDIASQKQQQQRASAAVSNVELNRVTIRLNCASGGCSDLAGVDTESLCRLKQVQSTEDNTNERARSGADLALDNDKRATFGLVQEQLNGSQETPKSSARDSYSQPVDFGSSRRPSEFTMLTMHNKSKLESRRKAAKMLTAIVILFGICYLPVHLINFLRQFISDIPQTDVTSSLSMLAHCICYLNSAINPIIYNHMNSVFRQEFRRSLECCLNWGLACRKWKCCAAFERRWKRKRDEPTTTALAPTSAQVDGSCNSTTTARKGSAKTAKLSCSDSNQMIGLASLNTNPLITNPNGSSSSKTHFANCRTTVTTTNATA